MAVFSQVVDSGNYRLAGEILNVTPSALSQTISHLEHSIGFPLFYRVGKKLIPTENGLALQKEFKSYSSLFTAAVQKIVEEKDHVRGVLKIGAYLEFAKSQLAPIIGQFLKEHPQAQVKLIFETPSRLQRLLEQGHLDLCFSIFPSVHTRLVESRPVYREELVLIAPKGFLIEKPSFESLMNTPMVEYYFTHQPLRRWLHLHFKKRPQSLPIRAYASTAEMVLELVKEGVGVGIVPQYILSEKDLHQLRIIRPTEKKFADHIWILEKKASSKRALQKTFEELVGKHFLKFKTRPRIVIRES